MLGLFVGESIDNVTLVAPAAVESNTTTKPTDDIFQARLQSLSAKEKAISVSLRPKIGAFANAYYGYPGFNTFKSMTSSNPNFNFFVGVKVNWNIGEYYTKKNRLNLIVTQRQAIATEQKTMEYNRSIQSMKINGEVEALESSIATDKRMVELRRSIRMSAQTQYANGVTDATTLLSKVTDEETSRLAMTIDELMATQAIYKLNRSNNR